MTEDYINDAVIPFNPGADAMKNRQANGASFLGGIPNFGAAWQKISPESYHGNKNGWSSHRKSALAKLRKGAWAALPRISRKPSNIEFSFRPLDGRFHRGQSSFAADYSPCTKQK